MINAVVRSTVMSVMMYISFPRQLSLDNDYHGIQLVLIHIFLLTHIKIHIILKNKFLIIKAKYDVIEPYYMKGTTPEAGSFLGPIPAIVEHIIKNITFRTNKHILLNT